MRYDNNKCSKYGYKCGYGCPQVPPVGGNMFFVSETFEGVRNDPELIACMDVDRDSSMSIVSVTVNYMAIPECQMGTPIATFIVTFEDGCGEQELRRYSQTATDYCTPQLVTFSFGENVGAGIYRVYAALEECFMNTPQNQATVDVYVVQPS